MLLAFWLFQIIQALYRQLTDKAEHRGAQPTVPSLVPSSRWNLQSAYHCYSHRYDEIQQCGTWLFHIFKPKSAPVLILNFDMSRHWKSSIPRAWDHLFWNQEHYHVHLLAICCPPFYNRPKRACSALLVTMAQFVCYYIKPSLDWKGV